MNPFLLATLLICSHALALNHHRWHKTRTTPFTLSFNYTVRQGKELKASQLTIIWNGITVKYVRPPNHQPHTITLILTAKKGWNTLKFVGKKKSSFDGVVISSVKLVRLSSQRHEGKILRKDGLLCIGKMSKKEGRDLQGRYISVNGLNSKSWPLGAYVCQLNGQAPTNPYQQQQP